MSNDHNQMDRGPGSVRTESDLPAVRRETRPSKSEPQSDDTRKLPGFPTLPRDTAAEEVGTKRLLFVGFFIVAMFFGAGFVWAAVAPLSSAAISPGVVSVAGNRKVIQHLEGGIVDQILVQEGASVNEGDLLIQLDQTKVGATWQALRTSYIADLALESRLVAERDGLEEMVPSVEFAALESSALVQDVIGSQGNIFRSGLESLSSRTKLFERQIGQLKEQIVGYEGMRKSLDAQLALLDQELSGLEQLNKKGLVRRSKLLGLQRQRAELEGDIAQNEARIASAQQDIDSIGLQIADVRRERSARATQQLRVVRDRLAQTREALPAAEDTLKRTSIRAPIGGRVVKLQAHTLGGVIAPGAAILEIVPGNDRLVIEARVQLKDRDIVQAGQNAQVRLTAFNQRSSLPVKGKVVWVSADRIVDERTGKAHYLARIELVDDQAVALGGKQIHPGMQAEVIIVTGRRTALSYFFRPLTRSFNRAFRED